MIRILPGGIKGATVQVNRQLERTLNELGGVRSPEMRAAGRTLAKSIRKQLSTRGAGAPSAPGQPPHRQTGALARSVRMVVAGASLQVGPARFTAAFLEEGVQSAKGEIRVSRGRRGRMRSRRRRRTVTIEPRPFMQKALAAVKDQMLGAVVRSSRQSLGRA